MTAAGSRVPAVRLAAAALRLHADERRLGARRSSRRWPHAPCPRGRETICDRRSIGAEDETRGRHRARNADAAGLRRRADLATSDRGQSGASRIEQFDVSDLPAKIACQIPRGDGSDGTYNPDQWMEPKDQRKVDEFIVFAMCAARQALDDAGWRPTSYEDQIATGVMIGSGIGGVEGIAETAIALEGARPAAGLAVLHSRPDHQSCVRLCVDRIRPQGAQPLPW